MKQKLNYGRIHLSYTDFDVNTPCIPHPFIKLCPIKINHKTIRPELSPNDCLSLLKLKANKVISFRDAYLEWYFSHSWECDIGEGRSFLRWLKLNHRSIKWTGSEFRLHDYFLSPLCPNHEQQDEMAKGLSFAIKPVWVEKRFIKLYLSDESVLSLFSLPFGEEEEFMELIKQYIKMRFKWEGWGAPAPTFLDWVRAIAKRPLFHPGDLGFHLQGITT